MNIITIPLGAVVSGPLAQLVGRRGSLKFGAVSFMAGWIAVYYADSVLMIYVGLLMLGLTGGLIESPLQVYVMEVCEPRVRGSGSATLSASIAVGVFLEIVVGSYVSWKTLALVNLVPLLVSLITLHLVPESPYWLASIRYFFFIFKDRVFCINPLKRSNFYLLIYLMSVNSRLSHSNLKIGTLNDFAALA